MVGRVLSCYRRPSKCSCLVVYVVGIVITLCSIFVSLPGFAALLQNDQRFSLRPSRHVISRLFQSRVDIPLQVTEVKNEEGLSVKTSSNPDFLSHVPERLALLGSSSLEASNISETEEEEEWERESEPSTDAFRADFWERFGLKAKLQEAISTSYQTHYSRYSQASGTDHGDCNGQPLRNIFLDFGANWGNTLRLYADIGGDKAEERPWTVFAFEASPYIHSYLEKKTAWLNGEGEEPQVDLPPTGSSPHLALYAFRYGCVDHPLDEMRDCMFNKLAGALEKLEPKPSLLTEGVVMDRMRVSRCSPHAPHFVHVPAAVGISTGNLTLYGDANQMLRGGARVDPSPIMNGAGIVNTVQMVDIVTWLESNFKEEDFVVVKMDVEGAEHGIMIRLLDEGKANLIDVLAWECHQLNPDVEKAFGIDFSDCTWLHQRICDETRIVLLTEGQDYPGWDSASSPPMQP